MKVLLAVSSYANGWPFIQDLERELNARGIEAHVLDLAELRLLQSGRELRFAPWALTALALLRKVGTATVLVFTIPFLRRLRGRYDAVTIHSCDHVFYYLAKALGRVSPSLSVMIWGSDFYQAEPGRRMKYRRIFDAARFIVFGNPVNAADFTGWYGGYDDKTALAGFGNSKLPLIDRLRPVDQGQLRAEFGLDRDKLVVTCGYNGREMQQHRLLLESVRALPAAVREKAQLLIPFAYGPLEAYRACVEQWAVATGMRYRIIDRHLEAEEVARLRLVSDLTLTAQLSDGLSHSVQEHLFAGNVVIAGDWLPYSYLVERGCFLLTAGPGDFARAVDDGIANFDEYRSRAAANAEVIASISSWDAQFENWKRLYENSPVPALTR